MSDNKLATLAELIAPRPVAPVSVSQIPRPSAPPRLTVYICQDCRRELVHEGRTAPTHCPDCRRRPYEPLDVARAGQERTCPACYARFVLTLSDIQALRRILAAADVDVRAVPWRCPSCRASRASAEADAPPPNKLECEDCGHFFWFRDFERRFFEASGWAPPRRCRACRRQRHAAGAVDASDIHDF